MIFYRRLTPFKAISFDLDDTLYSNGPIMRTTEERMIEYFSVSLAQFSDVNGQQISFSYHYWSSFRQQALNNTPALVHDVAALRLVSYTLGMQALGMPLAEAQSKAHAALTYFTCERSAFSLPESTHDFLQKLAEKIPLVAITNGNVDVEAIGIKKYFSSIYHAGKGIKQKPDSQMFDLACQKLNISTAQLLHVGDCGRADIAGAIKAGCQAAWLPRYTIGKPLTVLPHIQLTHVDELLTFT
jgi:HAD superfamily hydrolase (TIGR01549 family)